MTIEKIICTSGAMPNQFEGVVDGCPFYFRARHGEWYMVVGPPGADRETRADWETVGESPDGVDPMSGGSSPEPDGWWKPEDVEVFIRAKLDAWSKDRCPSCGKRFGVHLGSCTIVNNRTFTFKGFRKRPQVKRK